MLSKCANPACSNRFQYLREGKLFQFEILPPEAHPGLRLIEKIPARRVEHFWLCSHCAPRMTLALQEQRNVVVVPLEHAIRRAAAS